MAELLFLWNKINEYQTVNEASPTDQANILNQEKEHESQQSQVKEKNEEQEKLSKEIEALQLKLSLMQKQNDSEKLEMRTQIATTYNRMSVTPPQVPPSTWHKDFKISGQIGELGQKDRLTFSSLARQM